MGKTCKNRGFNGTSGEDHGKPEQECRFQAGTIIEPNGGFSSKPRWLPEGEQKIIMIITYAYPKLGNEPVFAKKVELETLIFFSNKIGDWKKSVSPNLVDCYFYSMDTLRSVKIAMVSIEFHEKNPSQSVARFTSPGISGIIFPSRGWVYVL